MFSTGAQDILKVFLQASAARGEWVAALQSFCSVSADKREPIHSLLLCEAYANGQQWEKALAICKEDLDSSTIPKHYTTKGYLHALESYVKGGALLLAPPSPISSSPGASTSVTFTCDDKSANGMRNLPAMDDARSTGADMRAVISTEGEKSHWEEGVAWEMATAGWDSAVQCEDRRVAAECTERLLHCCQQYIFPHLSRDKENKTRILQGWAEKVDELKRSSLPSKSSSSSSSLLSRTSSPCPPGGFPTSLRSASWTAERTPLSSSSNGAPATSSTDTPTATQPAIPTYEEATPLKESPSTPPTPVFVEKDKAFEKELTRLLHAPKQRNAWKMACELFSQMHRPHVSAFHALLQCLGRQGRVVEAERIVLDVFRYHKRRKSERESTRDEDSEGRGEKEGGKEHRYASLRLSRRLLQHVVDSSTRLHSIKICEHILSDRLFSSFLTPSTAMVLLSFLSSSPSIARQEWRCVMKWWEEEGHEWSMHEKEEKECAKRDALVTRQKRGYSLCTHLQVSSFVARCIIQGSALKGTAPDWCTALTCFQYSEECNPDLALLFKLRLLRVAKQWNAALELLTHRLEELSSSSSSPSSSPTGSNETWKKNSVLSDCCSIFLHYNPSRWIPEDIISLARQRIEKSGFS